MSSVRRPELSGRHVVRGALVSLGGSIGSRLLSFVALAVLARLLLPEDFGIVATSMIFIGLCRALMSRQFHLALVRLSTLERSHFDTAFTLSLIWGLCTGALLFVSANALAHVMNTPAIAPVLRVMALVLVLEGLVSPTFTRFERDLDLRPDVLSDWIGKIAQYSVSIGLALWWQSYWVLVLGFLAFTLIRVHLTYVFSPYRPRIDFTHTRAFLNFGGWLSGTGLAGYVITFTDITLIAMRLGSASAGVYNLASEIVRMASDYLAMPLGRAVYPGLSAVVEDRARLRPAFLISVECLLGMMLPIGVGLALVAPEVVHLVLGANWSGAVMILIILSPAAAFATVGYAAQSVIMAEGKTRAMFARNVAVGALQFPLIWIGIASGGLEGAAMGRAAGLLMQGVISLVIAAPLVGIAVYTLLLTPWRSFMAVAFMALGTVWIDGALLSERGLTDVASLGLKFFCAGLFYSLAHISLWLLVGRPNGFERVLLTRLLPALRR